jgi:prolyl-tRNA synthetase
MVRRDVKQKEFVPLDQAVSRAAQMLEAMQNDMFAKAKAFHQANTFEVNTLEELKAKADAGFLQMHYDGTAETEKRLKDEFGLTTRNRPFDLPQIPGRCVLTGQPSPGRIVFAKSY